MKQEVITRIKLTASTGMVLTNGEAYGKTIYLGVNDSVDSWHEITDAESKELQMAVELEQE